MLIPKHRKPTSPGTLIREILLEEKGLSQTELARQLGVSRSTVYRLVTGKSRLKPKVAEKLAGLAGTTVEFWVNAQKAVDLKDQQTHL